MNGREMVEHLQGVKRSAEGWIARCPAHDDKKASLCVKNTDDLVFYCQAGCSFESVLSQIPHTNGNSQKIVAEYDYRDEHGELRYQAVRYEPKDFRSRRPDDNGGWEWNLDGTPRVLYRLPELLKADPNRTVVIVEGEKDADKLASLGVVVTTNVGGAGKWRESYNKTFRGRKVVILSDNDEPGRKHAQQVARPLQGIAASVKVVQLPGLPEKGDVSDWLALGNGIKELRDLVEAAEDHQSNSILTRYPDFMAQHANDAEIIAFECCRGEVVLIQSVTNKGKSTAIRNAAFCLAAGREFAPLVPPQTGRRVLLVNFEGSRGRFQSDLRVMERVFDEAEIGRIQKNFFPTHAPEFDDEPLSLSRHMKIFEAESRAIAPDVIIVDTASAAFNIKNESDNSEIAQLMKTLIRLARQLNCVVVVVHHIGKAKAEDGQTREAAHRGRGASAWADFSSSIFNLECDRSTDLVTLTCGKRKTGTGENYETVMRLDRNSRWFVATSDAPPRPLSNREQVLRALREFDSLSTGGVEQVLAGKMSERTVRTCLAELVADGLATQPKRGHWKVREHESEPESALGNSGNAHRELPNCLTDNKGNFSSDLGALGKLGNPLYELPKLPNRENYREPTKEEWAEAAKNPDEWERLVTVAEGCGEL